ncbi:HAMP domain-containing sensor histidine kinase [Amphritea sp. 2_MG-2023]|uniref:sensor histidine kinase n=1 Tax=Amphritea TaxID=515417 RepID=UPI001C072FC7|nr:MULTISPECIES: HAMP domain-containing sensor histidine kinase [Amphritea]MBU2965952.1 HAMP domain-containing histidine kinase [Amphritea atlantica]MDO6418042.1 HAMP domain-containing sensor histidine kinase [Amphritea sp. 2_MG-2023]
MKIRPSLKLYFFISVVLLGSVMAIGFSLLSVNYFINGLDKGLNIVMKDIAKTAEVEDGQPIDLIGFNIASRWQDTPDIIQQNFVSPPTEAGQLQKLKDQSSIFSIPENIYFVVLTYTPSGEKRFVSKVILERNRLDANAAKQPKNRLYWAFFTALAAIALFAFCLVMIMQKIAKPIESLKNWAKSLTQENTQTPPPDFSYNELNVLASLVQNSLVSAHQSLEREQQFLSYASHELRTPIAVIRSNVDLLKRLSETSPLSDKQALTLQRIQRAGLTMSDLTETLLWLSHKDKQNIALVPINLHEKVKQLTDELNYLLNTKNVTVKIETDEARVNVAATACHIVLSNLIRNAYQHTQQGLIEIKQQGSRVTITNSHESDKESAQVTKIDTQEVSLGYGYGLGLQLSEKIINRHGWLYKVADIQGCYQVTVDFDGHDQTT